MNSPSQEDEKLREAEHSVFRVIHRVLEPYRLEEAEAVHFTRAFRSAAHGFVSLEGAGYFKAGIDADESYARLMRRLVSSLAKSGEPC